MACIIFVAMFHVGSYSNLVRYIYRCVVEMLAS